MRRPSINRLMRENCQPCVSAVAFKGDADALYGPGAGRRRRRSSLRGATCAILLVAIDGSVRTVLGAFV
jgi:hypothetical protein